MMTVTNKEYPIKSLEDFLMVPEDKIDACLSDFKTWLSLARQSAPVTALLQAIAPAEISAVFATHSFTWIDDGLPGIRAIQVTDENDQECIRIPVATD
ncbi:hypothetical protein [Paraburkholderia phenoliruptrix]|uniref:hypothetical protein n=1 Tax=Paraburkholderia phenoliruptrix TaxID=252970 RepID=UPI0034CD4CD5